MNIKQTEWKGIQIPIVFGLSVGAFVLLQAIYVHDLLEEILDGKRAGNKTKGEGSSSTKPSSRN